MTLVVYSHRVSVGPGQGLALGELACWVFCGSFQTTLEVGQGLPTGTRTNAFLYQAIFVPFPVSMKVYFMVISMVQAHQGCNTMKILNINIPVPPVLVAIWGVW